MFQNSNKKYHVGLPTNAYFNILDCGCIMRSAYSIGTQQITALHNNIILGWFTLT